MNINSLMDSVGCNVIMITDKYNLRYITGFRGGEGTALILRDKGYLLVDSRYTEAAGREVKEKKDAAVSFEVIEFNNAQPKYKLAAEIILSLNIVSKKFNEKIFFIKSLLTLNRYMESNSLRKLQLISSNKEVFLVIV